MKFRLFLLSNLIVLSTGVLAGDAEEALIDKIVAAYGGAAVAEMTSIQLHDRVLTTSLGQEHNPNLDEINSFSQALTVDYANNRAVLENWGSGRGGNFQGATFSDGENAQNVNFQAMTFGAAPSADMYTFAGGFMRTTDALLVYELNKARDKAKIEGEAAYMNRPHTKLTMPFPQSPDLTLFIDNETNLISKMIRTTQFGNLDYVFGDWQENGGVTYAGSYRFFVGGDPNLISTKREMTFNATIDDSAFALPEGLSEEGERIDVSEMMVNKISDRVFHVGQGGGWTLFVDSGESIVAVGGYPALTQRFEKFQEESGIHKPLSYQIVSHHHNDHLGGLAEAVALGAKLVTVKENVETIKDSLTPEPGDWQIMTVGKRTTFGSGSGQVEVFEVSTQHAESNLVVYVPSERTIFIADHMGSPYRTGTPTANLNTVTMLEALEALDINIRNITTAHNARVFRFKDMQDSVAAYKPASCEMNRIVCI